MPRTASISPTPRFGLIGFPAAHSQSPKLFREFCGGRWEYDILETPSFEEAWNRFVDGPYKAVNVTAPFKEPAFERAEIKSPECRRIKAANILVKTPSGIAAYNSDYLAVREMLTFYSSKIRPNLVDSDPSTRKLVDCPVDSKHFALNKNNLGPGQPAQPSPSGLSIAVIGFGGAGKAALAAAEDFAAGNFTDDNSTGKDEWQKDRYHLDRAVRLFRHNEISDGVKSDIIIYTLPKAVPGIDKLDCSVLIEANYKDPCLSNGLTASDPDQTLYSGCVLVNANHHIYVPGTEWLRLQAELGFPLMVSE